MSDDKFDRWMSSMKMMLGFVSNQYVKASSISNVPEQLRKSDQKIQNKKLLRKSKEEAYMPKVVSIGPLHYRTRTDLVYMEEIKWHCLRSLLYRTENAEESLTRCSKAMYALDEVVRASYVDDIRFNSYDLAKIMLLDGCFLLELLISNDEKLNVLLKSHFPGPGAEVGKTEVVLSDLTVLENQIPLFILNVLFLLLFKDTSGDKLLFTEDSSTKYDEVRKSVNKLALSLFGYSLFSSPENSCNRAHFLELMHSCLTGKKEEIDQERNHLSVTVDGNFKMNPELKRCSARLKAAGVTIMPLYNEADPAHRKLVESFLKMQQGNSPVSLVTTLLNIIRPPERRHADNPDLARIRFGCDIEFSDGLLKIQPLPITEKTEVMWRNFIAWEQNRTTHEKFLPLKRTNCKFSQYALLFKGLICCEHDIQQLKRQNVLLVNEAERSNEDLLTFFRTIADGIEIDVDENSNFGKQLCKLNTYSGARGKPRIIWHHCRRLQASSKYRCRSLYRILIRDHIPTVWKLIGVIAAIVLLGLTIAQTVFAAKSS